MIAPSSIREETQPGPYGSDRFERLVPKKNLSRSFKEKEDANGCQNQRVMTDYPITLTEASIHSLEQGYFLLPFLKAISDNPRANGHKCGRNTSVVERIGSGNPAEFDGKEGH